MINLDPQKPAACFGLHLHKPSPPSGLLLRLFLNKLTFNSLFHLPSFSFWLNFLASLAQNEADVNTIRQLAVSGQQQAVGSLFFGETGPKVRVRLPLIYFVGVVF